MRRRTGALLSIALLAACSSAKRPAPPDRRAPPAAGSPAPPLPDAGLAAGTSDAGAAPGDAGGDASLEPRGIGPYEAPLVGKRKVYYAIPKTRREKTRLIGSLHGVCNPPGYTCGYWLDEGTSYGIMVCPEGNARCGGVYDPPTWTVGSTQMEADLERAIAVVDGLQPGELTREGAVLTGFSRGAYAAVEIAKRNPGKWPYLILNEADVALEAAELRAAGVRAVALVAGEYGTQVGGERKTAAKLAKQGFRARLWVMPKAGHFYSGNIGEIMREAMDFVLASDSGDAGADGG